jgi:hypothetical protein
MAPSFPFARVIGLAVDQVMMGTTGGSKKSRGDKERYFNEATLP